MASRATRSIGRRGAKSGSSGYNSEATGRGANPGGSARTASPAASAACSSFSLSPVSKVTTAVGFSRRMSRRSWSSSARARSSRACRPRGGPRGRRRPRRGRRCLARPRERAARGEEEVSVALAWDDDGGSRRVIRGAGLGRGERFLHAAREVRGAGAADLAGGELERAPERVPDDGKGHVVGDVAVPGGASFVRECRRERCCNLLRGSLDRVDNPFPAGPPFSLRRPVRWMKRFIVFLMRMIKVVFRNAINFVFRNMVRSVFRNGRTIVFRNVFSFLFRTVPDPNLPFPSFPKTRRRRARRTPSQPRACARASAATTRRRWPNSIVIVRSGMMGSIV